MGSWTYVYDVLRELTSQTDAKSQIINVSYDLLGRMTQRVEPNGGGFVYNNWVYDAATTGIGQLAYECNGSVNCTSAANSIYYRIHTYDTTGRPSSATITLNAGTARVYALTYDTLTGRVKTTTYPSALVIANVFNSYGYLSQLKDNGSGAVYWTINARDAELHATQQTAASNLVTNQAFDSNTGLFQTIQAGIGGGTGVANFSYAFDTIGNLTRRTDTVEAYSEYFCYDPLNRLTTYAVGSVCTGSKTVGYDAIGNITSKSDTGTYTYPASGLGSVQPHAVSSIVGTVNGVSNPNYSYDADGNLTCVNPLVSGCATPARTFAYTSANMTAQVVQGSTTLTLTYDPGRNRAIQVEPAGTTNYLNDPMTGAREELYVDASTGFTWWHDYLSVDGQIIAERFNHSATTYVRYFTNDPLGSVSILTDDAGVVSERDSYDAWGNRRNPNGTDAVCTLGSQTKRGFTNQEQMDAICAVNLNARIYDPVLGRMNSPDVVVSNPYDPQNLNRYAYVEDEPTTKTDVTGNCGEDACVGETALVIACAEGGCEAVATAIAEGAASAAEGIESVVSSIEGEGAATGEAGASPGGAASSRPAGSVEGQDTSSLRTNMGRAGREPGPGEHAHHIVAQRAPAAQPARQALQREGISVQNEANGASLPAEVHSKIHTDSYYDAVNNMVTAAASKGRESLLQVLRNLAKAMETSRTPPPPPPKTPPPPTLP
jgi:RHS repeat-associated protein